MKSVKVLSLLLVFLGLIPSCRCPEVDPFYMPTAISADAVWNNSLYTDFEDLTIEEAEGFELWVQFLELQYMAKNHLDFSFSNSLHATQPCPEAGEQGLKHKISTVLVTSNTEF